MKKYGAMNTDKKDLTLDLALVTYRPEGIERVARQNLPVMPGVRYIVSWQDHRNAPVPKSLACRDDIEIHRFDKLGQSLNRNNAMAHCTADIVLHADDDVIYKPEWLGHVIDAFSENPDVDVATFRTDHDPGCIYPEESVRLGLPLPKGYYAVTFGIAYRRAAHGIPLCDPQLGLGSPRMHGGEDEIFLLSCIKRGLNCRFFPVKICSHPHLSTGTKSSLSDCNLRALGCVIALYYPMTWPLRAPLKAWRVARKKQAGFFGALLYITQGVVASRKIKL